MGRHSNLILSNGILMNSTRTWFGLVAILILIDQLTKLAASSLGWSIFLNDKFAFSLPIPVVMMYGIYAVVLFGMSWFVYNTWSRFTPIQKYAWAFVYSGGLSNIGERLALGFVRDFIPIASGTLNGADFFIFFGLLLLLAGNRLASPTEKSL
jgi:lipoprotein signal peptidase